MILKKKCYCIAGSRSFDEDNQQQHLDCDDDRHAQRHGCDPYRQFGHWRSFHHLFRGQRHSWEQNIERHQRHCCHSDWYCCHQFWSQRHTAKPSLYWWFWRPANSPERHADSHNWNNGRSDCHSIVWRCDVSDRANPRVNCDSHVDPRVNCDGRVDLRVNGLRVNCDSRADLRIHSDSDAAFRVYCDVRGVSICDASASLRVDFYHACFG